MSAYSEYSYATPEVGARNIDVELQRHDTYLEHYHMTRSSVTPDGNSLFASLCAAGRLKDDPDGLRRTTAEYIASNLADFNKFMAPDPNCGMLDSMKSAFEKLDMLKNDGSWVGYETVMALTRYLDAVIVVTSGGSYGNDGVRTDSFYYGDKRPDKEIHITWLSAGFYHPVRPVSDTDPKLSVQYDNQYDNVDGKINCDNDSGCCSPTYREDSQRSSGSYGSTGDLRRQPSHICQCKWNCDCRRWSQLYTFPGDVTKKASQDIYRNEVGARYIDVELQRQDTYLEHYHMTRCDVTPDGNSLFASLCSAGHLKEDPSGLRRTTAEYIAGNLADYNKFMAPDPNCSMLDSMKSAFEKLDMIKNDGSWVGYETVMALTRYLDAVIVVTSGGSSGNDGVRTDSFYYGDQRPDKEIHITWLSAGFYHPVLPVSDAEPKLSVQYDRQYDNVDGNIYENDRDCCSPAYRQDSQRSSGSYESTGDLRRQPSHICQCKWKCDCKRWSQLYTFPGDVTKSSPPPQKASQDIDWHEVFSQLSNDGHVLRRWKFVMRWLKLSEAALVDVDDLYKRVSEKVLHAFSEHWRSEHPGGTIADIQAALRKERLNLAADNLEKYK